jgi:RimJ/RimL family protein N-acetyltransferase
MDGRVEIAYFTFPGNEGRGIATAMAKALLGLAKRASPMIRIYAQTLPQHSASTRVLEKLGFQQTVEVDHPEDGKVWEWELMDKAQPINSGNGRYRARP